MKRITICAVLCSFFALGMTPPAEPTYENLNAVLWLQTSVEYKASAIQTYRLAERSLTQGLKNPHWTAALEQTGNYESLLPAVILDLDETVLDNSAFNARMVSTGEKYSNEAWAKWVNERTAGLVPGAMEFLQFAHANGVVTLYVTNRVCDPGKEDDPTVKVLRSLQLPTEPVVDRLFCAQSSSESDKTARRARAATKYRILLLFGDQLGDFLQIPSDLSGLEGRQQLFEAHQNLWGERWFQLPNPMYGSWEGAVGYGLKEKLSRLRK